MSARWLYCTSFVLLVATSAFAQGPGELDTDWDSLLQLSPKEATPASGPAEAKAERPRPRGARKRPRHKQRVRDKPASKSGYAALKDSWHAPPLDDAVETEAGPGLPPLVLRVVGEAEPVVLTPESEAGGFDEGDLAAASHALGSFRGGPRAHPRLLDLVYRAARKFDVPYVHVVSGIRRDRRGSRHSHGLAVDIVLPGIKDGDLADYFRAQGFVGVGTYTRAGFVHVDVRDQSFFWVDRSPPGKRYKIHQVHAEQAKAADEAALARGEPPFINPNDLQGALDRRALRRRTSKHKRKSGASKKSRAESSPGARPRKVSASPSRRDAPGSPQSSPTVRANEASSKERTAQVND